MVEHGPYKHDAEFISEAVGIDTDRILTLINAILTEANESPLTISAVIEKIENSDLSRRELSFLLADNMVKEEDSDPSDLLKQLLGGTE